VAVDVGEEPGDQRPADLADDDDQERKPEDHADGAAPEVVGADRLHERPAQAPGDAVQDRKRDHHRHGERIGQKQ